MAIDTFLYLAFRIFAAIVLYAGVTAFIVVGFLLIIVRIPAVAKRIRTTTQFPN